jgi:hypothetical protein
MIENAKTLINHRIETEYEYRRTTKKHTVIYITPRYVSEKTNVPIDEVNELMKNDKRLGSAQHISCFDTYKIL